MALTTPILNSLVAFDAVTIQNITFNVVGGDVVTGNTLRVYRQDSGVLVYENNVVSYQYANIIPANTLVNGVYYYAYVITHNASGQSSGPSNKIQFYCYSSPSWVLNVVNGEQIATSTLAVSVTYNQSENEPLNDYTFLLYNASRNQISSSGVKYTNSTEVPYVGRYNFMGLEDNTSYYIRAIGHTTEGTNIDSGFIRFSVIYSQVESYNALTVQNNCLEGYISYYSSVFGIVGRGYLNASFILLPNGRNLNLTIGNEDNTQMSYAVWDEGVHIAGDFTFRVWFSHPTALIERDNFTKQNLIKLINDETEETIEINYCWDKVNNVSYVEALIGNYYIISNSVPIPLDDIGQFIQFQRVGNLYNLNLLTGVSV